MRLARIGRTALLALALATVMCASAGAAPTVRLSDRGFQARKVVTAQGSGFQTQFSFCTPGPVRLTIRRGLRKWDLGTVELPWISPIGGTFTARFRIPAGISAGRGYFEATQVGRDATGLRCEPVESQVRRPIVVTDEPFDCTEIDEHGFGCEPFSPVPRVRISAIYPPAGGPVEVVRPPAGLEPPSPICIDDDREIERQCEEDQMAGVRVRVQVGSSIDVSAVDFDPPADCPRGVAVTLVDHSGSVFVLGRTTLSDEGTFTAHVRIPAIRVTPGIVSLTAALDTTRAACVVTTGLRLRVRPVPLAVALYATSNGALLFGTGWATDACDGRVAVSLLRNGRLRHLADVRSGAFGVFRLKVALPKSQLVARNRIVATQRQRREIGDRRHKSARTRCVDERPTVDVKRVGAKPKPLPAAKAPVAAPPNPTASPSPSASPTPTPTPAPDTTLAAAVEKQGELRVRGTHWEGEGCHKSVTIALDATVLGTADPAIDGSFDVVFTVNAKAGQTVTATQPRCDQGPPLERTATVPG